MPRERDKDRKLFHRGHYEVIAARFREEASKYQDGDGYPISTEAAYKLNALLELADNLSHRFEFDNSEHDRMLFLERCGLITSATV